MSVLHFHCTFLTIWLLITSGCQSFFTSHFPSTSTHPSSTSTINLSPSIIIPWPPNPSSDFSTILTLFMPESAVSKASQDRYYLLRLRLPFLLIWVESEGIRAPRRYPCSGPHSRGGPVGGRSLGASTDLSSTFGAESSDRSPSTRLGHTAKWQLRRTVVRCGTFTTLFFPYSKNRPCHSRNW